MKRKIEDMTQKLEKADDDNKTLKASLKRTEDDNRKVKNLLDKAVTNATILESSLEESMKNIKDLREKLKDTDERLKDMTVSRNIALRDQSKNYQAYQNADKKNKDLERLLRNATDRVQELESEDERMKIYEENLNLLRSLKRAQELLLNSSTFIKEIGDAGAWRIGEVKRDRKTKDFKNLSGKTALLVERLQELNGNLVKSNILDYAIYDGFVEAFNVAIKELCTPNSLILRGARRLYRLYIKKANILDSDLTKAFNGIMNAFSIFHTLEHPQMRNFPDFDRQMYREFENILLIFQGIAQERTLSVNLLPGYGVIVFWELTSAERALIEKKKLYVG
jgi:hypothetical protein